ncbi:hypothetical protein YASMINEVIRUS_834 [Yasminevirus sp. GU-2018]|uniref:Uncharacterized protein n=1 Tax=Yasminevirus sp. GU-2018 TaxID=2420051 RepID=A0A5K0U9V0_9VIRU|nr:hypothetical protein YASMINEVIRUS_834 [Yasminevirus sp. GU-2018]
MSLTTNKSSVVDPSNSSNGTNNVINVNNTTDYEETHRRLVILSKNNQKALDDLKSVHASLNWAEDVLREKIRLRYSELETLNRDFANIMDTYAQIIKTSSSV